MENIFKNSDTFTAFSIISYSNWRLKELIRIYFPKQNPGFKVDDLIGIKIQNKKALFDELIELFKAIVEAKKVLKFNIEEYLDDLDVISRLKCYNTSFSNL